MNFIILTVIAFSNIVVDVHSQRSNATDGEEKEDLTLKEDLPPPPEFTVYDVNGLPCVLIQMDATIQIEPKRTANKKVTTSIPKSANADGDCGNGEDSKIVLKWKSFIFTWHFQKSRVSDAWYIDFIQMTYNISDKVFGDLDTPGLPGTTTVIKSDDPLTLYLTPLGRSYSCGIPKDIKLFDDKRVSRITITLNRVQIQPFAAMTQRQFGDAFLCPDQAGRRSDTVPMAVGTMLALVSLCTVAGYGIYRYYKVKNVDYEGME